jgi:acyl-CoA synthetase (NDP forming)
MGHGAPCGNIFSSPSASQVYSVARSAENGGGVVLGLGSAEAVQAAAVQMLQKVRASHPKALITGFTLQQMANGAAAEWINAEHPSLLMIGDALAVRASAAASEPALDAHPHSLAA